MLSWHYRNPDREREQWFYLPSMRKARRSSPAEDDENTLGTVLTVEEMTSWRPQHETYRLLGVQPFPGYASSHDGKESYRGERCYVIEAFPKEKMRCGQNEYSGCARVTGAAFSRRFLINQAKYIKPFFAGLIS